MQSGHQPSTTVVQAEVVRGDALSSEDDELQPIVSGKKPEAEVIAAPSLPPMARRVARMAMEGGATSSAAGIPLYKYTDLGPEANAQFRTHGFKDVWGIPAFLIVVAAVFATGAYNQATTAHGEDSMPPDVATAVTHAVALSFVASVALAVTSLFVIKACPFGYILFSQALVVLFCVVIAIACFKAGSVISGLFNLFLSGASFWWALCALGRVPFAALILRTSANLNLRYWGSFVVGAASLVFVMVFSAYWGWTMDFVNTQLDARASRFQDEVQRHRVTSAGPATDSTTNGGASNSTNSGDDVDLVGLLLSLVARFALTFTIFWVIQVCANVVHVTASGVVATWYFVGEQRMPRTAVPANLKRAMTTSFGSICFGSAVVALLKTIYYFLRMAVRSSRHEVVRLIAMCLLGVIERLTEMFNIYAFTQVAIYGHDFVTAAKQTFALVKESGWSLVINDCLAWNSMAITNVFGSFLICAAFWAASGPMAGFVSLMVATATFTIFFRPVYAGVATQFVCVAENPDAMSVANPEYGAAMLALKPHDVAAGATTREQTV